MSTENRLPTSSEVEYRDVPGFPGYRIGSDGSLMSCRIRGGRGGIGDLWRPIRDRGGPNGYRMISFRRDAKQFSRYVHRIVLLAFVGPAPTGMQARHHNGINTDNRLSNLSWATPTENHADKIRHGTSQRGERHNCVKLTEEIVQKIRRLRSEGLKLIVIARRFAISEQNVSKICRRELWAHLESETSNG